MGLREWDREGDRDSCWDSTEAQNPDRSHLLYIIIAIYGLVRDTVELMGTQTSKRSHSFHEKQHCFVLRGKLTRWVSGSKSIFLAFLQNTPPPPFYFPVCPFSCVRMGFENHQQLWFHSKWTHISQFVLLMSDTLLKVTQEYWWDQYGEEWQWLRGNWSVCSLAWPPYVWQRSQRVMLDWKAGGMYILLDIYDTGFIIRKELLQKCLKNFFFIYF